MREGSRNRRIFGIDAGLLIAAFAIVCTSIYVLNTAIVSGDGGVQHDFAYRQIVFAIIGVGIAFVVSRIPVGTWERFWPHALGLAIAGVVAVRFVGTVVNGSRRWIDLGPISLQPSEFGKALALIGICGFLATRAREIRDWRVFYGTLGILAIPAAVVFIQPDFGTAQIYGYLALGVLFFAGARWVHFAILGGTVLALALVVLAILPAVGIEVLHDFQKQRLTGFLDQEADAQGGNYQTIQAKVAIGSGQFAGRSTDEASQVQQGFLPEPQTDFIFATLSERHGFLGGAFVLGLYMFLLSRLLYAVGVAATPYARLIAGGVATLFFAQVCVNVGMVIGVLPVVGVPLPMFSYGGSALWTSMALLGLVVAVLREAESPSVRYQRRTGRPSGGFGSLRATGGERNTAPPRKRGESISARTPLVGGDASRRRRRTRSR